MKPTLEQLQKWQIQAIEYAEDVDALEDEKAEFERLLISIDKGHHIQYAKAIRNRN